MKTKLRSTKAYGLFSHNKHQQPMRESHVARVQQSIRENGFLASKPITVISDPDNAGKFIIVDGHHRFEAAKREDAELFYVVESSDVQSAMGDINFIVRKWSSASLVAFYADRGNKHYQELQEYVVRGIPLQQASSLLIGQCAGSGNASKAIRAGEFKIKTRDMIDSIISMIDAIKPSCSHVGSKNFIDAISALLFVPEFDHALFVKRAINNPRMLVKCATRDQMLDVIEEIYNFRAHDKIPLRHLAETKLKARRDLAKMKNELAA